MNGNKDTFSRSLKFPGIYRARVLSNLDPNFLGRVKAQVYPMLSEIIDPELLPWCVPATPLVVGSGSNTGSYAIPRVDTFIFVFFENGDIYQPVYFAEAPNAVFGLPGNMSLHYPNTFGFDTPGLFSLLIDDQGKLFQFMHPSGTTISMDADGSVYIASMKDISVNSQGNMTVYCGGTMNVTSVANMIVSTLGMTITCLANISINAINAEIKASGTALLQSTGVCTIKGSVVSINP